MTIRASSFPSESLTHWSTRNRRQDQGSFGSKNDPALIDHSDGLLHRRRFPGGPKMPSGHQCALPVKFLGQSRKETTIIISYTALMHTR